MLEQLLPVLQNSIQAAVQPVLLRHRKIYPRQHVHGALVKPLPMHTELTAGVDEAIHRQQFQHLRPTHIFAPPRQFPLPESIQFQLPPQLAAQPTVAVRPRATQLHFIELDLNRIQDSGWSRPIFRKEAECGRTLLLFVEHL